MSKTVCVVVILVIFGVEGQRNRSSRGDVAFTVVKATEKLEAFSHVHFRDVITNKGRGWDRQTSEFVVPVNGGYFFIFHAIGAENSDFTMALVKNGHQVTAYGTKGTFQHGSNSVFLELHKGDVISLKLQQGKIFEPRRGAYTAFSGFILFKF